MPQNVATASTSPEVLIRRRDEFLGISLAVGGALLASSLISHHPGDPSLFSFVSTSGVRPQNWVGRFGASFSEGALQIIGYASYLIPAVLFVAGARRFVSRPLSA